ncbi:MAG: hypothetical protein ACYC35_16730, partial [Pirellulales bacterium]
MGISDLLQRIGLKAEQVAQAKARNFAELVRQVADEKSIDADSAAAVLEAAGKTPQDLQTEVNRLLDRRRLRAKLAEYPRLHAEVTTAE